MAVARAQEDSSSMSPCTYDVFLSFRGEDTRKNFTDHLYTALVQAGIHTFRDDDEIERGEYIQAELQKAIKESKISIIVFSRNYASSSWCLNELVMIMERRRTVGHTVVPVFYDLDPSQVTEQTGSYARAFAEHEESFKGEMHRVEGWRAALREVADLEDLAGMALNDRHEPKFIQDIVRQIWKKLPNGTPHLVGIGSRIKDINLWLQDESSDVRIATIFGIGGIGKTTIAKTVYNLNFERFQGMSFLANVRNTLKEPNGLVSLQNQLLSNLLKGKMNEVYSVDEGIIKIKDAICCRKVLIVLDDVDQLDQLDAIIGRQEGLCPGSKIIITTTHARLLRDNEACEKFKVKQMEDFESRKLFSWHAFGQGHPSEGYMECTRKAIHYCGGIPLALQVLGSSLSGKTINVWNSALQKLEAIPHSQIQNVLRISYDSLQNEHDKNLFLDIACFFIGKDKDYIVGILDRCGFFSRAGIQNLIDRCLLVVNEENKVIMHQLLRDMGREIIRQESTDDPGKRSRLWHHKDAFIVLKEKTGTETIKGLTLDLHMSMEDKRGKTIVSVNYAKRHHDEDSLDKSMIGNCSKRCRLGFFSWQSMNTTSRNSFQLSNQVDLETKTFMKMHKLKLLQLNYVKLNGDYEDFPKRLIWLCWRGFPLKSIPTNFCLEKLVALDMRYSYLKRVWNGTKFLAELKFLNLSYSHDLVSTPDFSGLPSLERLILKDCRNLVEVDESIGDLHQLVLLNLKDCKNLRKLPRKIGMLKSLGELILSGCSKLDELPEELGKKESLRVLYVDGISINQLHATTSDTKKQNLLSITSWHSKLRSWLSPTRTRQPTSFSLAFLPHSLVHLNLAYCNLSDDAISYSLSSLASLEYLNLSGNPIRSLTESISGLANLKDLQVEDCPWLQSLSKFPMSLESVFMRWCPSLERVPNIPGLPSLFVLESSYCDSLFEVQGLFKIDPITNTDTTVIRSLCLSNLESLGSIQVVLFNNFTRTKKKTPRKVLQECGVLSIFLPGSEVPSYFSHQTKESSISFDVPPLVGHKICGLNLCTLYALDCDVEFEEYSPYYAKINNKTKRMRWTYSPMAYACPESEVEDMLWLSHWKLGDQLEGGDQLDVLVVLPPYFQVKMCGICLVYEPENSVTQSNNEETVLSSFPWYQTITLTQAGVDASFRCHHSYTTHSVSTSKNETLPFECDYYYEPNPQVEEKRCVICEEL